MRIQTTFLWCGLGFFFYFPNSEGLNNPIFVNVVFQMFLWNTEISFTNLVGRGLNGTYFINEEFEAWKDLLLSQLTAPCQLEPSSANCSFNTFPSIPLM